MGAIMANGRAPAKAGGQKGGLATLSPMCLRAAAGCHAMCLTPSLMPRDRLLEKKQSFARPIASN
jgi:hypothetical protein